MNVDPKLEEYAATLDPTQSVRAVDDCAVTIVPDVA